MVVVVTELVRACVYALLGHPAISFSDILSLLFFSSKEFGRCMLRVTCKIKKFFKKMK